jgi:carboxylesterase type B
MDPTHPVSPSITGPTSLASPSQQNVDLIDQRLAIQVVRDNMPSEGADPSRIGA